MPRLENWIVIAKGEVFDDEKGRFKDGEVISTSKILRIGHCHLDADVFKTLKTLNTEYTLGQPRQFPKELGIE